MFNLSKIQTENLSSGIPVFEPNCKGFELVVFVHFWGVNAKGFYLLLYSVALRTLLHSPVQSKL